MNPDDYTETPDTEDEGWVIDHYLDLALEDEDIRDGAAMVAVGRTAALMTMADAEFTHHLADQLVNTVEEIMSQLTGDNVRLDDSTACQVNAVIQVALVDYFETQMAAHPYTGGDGE